MTETRHREDDSRMCRHMLMDHSFVSQLDCPGATGEKEEEEKDWYRISSSTTKRPQSSRWAGRLE